MLVPLSTQMQTRTSNDVCFVQYWHVSLRPLIIILTNRFRWTAATVLILTAMKCRKPVFLLGWINKHIQCPWGKRCFVLGSDPPPRPCSHIICTVWTLKAISTDHLPPRLKCITTYWVVICMSYKQGITFSLHSERTTSTHFSFSTDCKLYFSWFKRIVSDC